MGGKKEDLTKKLDDLKSSIFKLQLEIQDKQNEYSEILNKLYELDKDMVKVICFNCGGSGYKKVEGKNKVCDLCNGNGYIWMKQWKNNTK